MQNLIKISKSLNGLELGTFCGKQTLAIATSLPQMGKITTVDVNDDFVEFATKYWKKANVQNKI